MNGSVKLQITVLERRVIAMKLWVKTAICISLSLMCLFTCVGYALVSEIFTITGTAQVMPAEPEGIYISKVEVYQAVGLTNNSTEIVLPTNLSSSFNVSTQNARITYEITVHNKSDMTYWYLGTVVAPETDPNGFIGTTNGISITTTDGASLSSTLFDQSDWVPPHTERTFYATYVFGSRPQGNVTTLINFSFGLHMGSVSDAFLKVLNDTASDYGYKYLSGAFDNNYSENKGSTVIGNIGEHEEIFNNLFGSSLTVNMNGEDLPVTILVERKNVDGNGGSGDAYSTGNLSGCEYTVYITVDDLDKTGLATVYAVSYTRGADGIWYMIGELYEGKSNVEVYENSSDPDDLAFDVDSWRAVQKEYTVVGNLSYKVAYPYGEQPEQYDEISELMGKPDQSFFNRINNFANGMLTNACHVLYSYTNNSGQQVEHTNNANLSNPGYIDLKRAFDRLKPYLILDNGATNVRLDYKASSLNRAEIIRMLEDIKASYDYYLAVNS